MSNYIHLKVWDEITYPFPNFNGACDYLSMLGWKLIHAKKCTLGPGHRPIYIEDTFESHEEMINFIQSTVWCCDSMYDKFSPKSSQ